MRYHYDKPSVYSSMYGETYICDHPVYRSCTLYRIGENGLAVIQQRYDPKTKQTHWGEIDPWLTDCLYLHPGFRKLFEKCGGPYTDELYPTLTIRQVMWSLRMKPLPRSPWETYFDRKPL